MDTRTQIPFRRKVLRMAQGALYWSRGLDRMPQRGGATILMYHSVPPPESARYIDPAWRMSEAAFEQQAEFLAQNRNVISLSDLVRRLHRKAEPEPGTVVLTFDDGYRDNLTVVAPILQRYCLPATIFLATAYVERGENQWVDQLYTLFMARTAQRCELLDKEAEPQVFDLQDGNQCQIAYRRCNRRLLESNYVERTELLERLKEQLQPSEDEPPRLTLNWPEVRELHNRYPWFEIGVHTAHHLDLAHADPDIVRAELSQCIENVERKVGLRPHHFSFPYGRSTPAARELVAAAGLHSAMGGGGHRPVSRSSDVYNLPRLDALMSPTQLRLRTHPGFGSLPERLAMGL